MLGGAVLDIELQSLNVYNCYENACLEYSYIVNLHQAKNSLSQVLGSPTGSFDRHGMISGSLSGSHFSSPYVFSTLKYKIVLLQIRNNTFRTQKYKNLMPILYLQMRKLT